jgi:hypothetical protein
MSAGCAGEGVAINTKFLTGEKVTAEERRLHDKVLRSCRAANQRRSARTTSQFPLHHFPHLHRRVSGYTGYSSPAAFSHIDQHDPA